MSVIEATEGGFQEGHKNLHKNSLLEVGQISSSSLALKKWTF